jgi:hypothetical protein
MRGKHLDLFVNCRGAQVNPAYDTLNKVIAICQLQQPASLFKRLPGLHCDRTRDTRRFEQGSEVRRQAIVAEHIHAVGHPGVVARVVNPEMLVAIDSHRPAAPRGNLPFDHGLDDAGAELYPAREGFDEFLRRDTMGDPAGNIKLARLHEADNAPEIFGR